MELGPEELGLLDGEVRVRLVGGLDELLGEGGEGVALLEVFVRVVDHGLGGHIDSGGAQCCVQQFQQSTVLVDRGGVEKLFGSGKDSEYAFNLRLVARQLVLFHSDPGTVFLHHAFKELLHGLARDWNRIDQVSGGAGGFVLSDAPVYIQTDAALVAVAKELEAVQVLLLGSQALQLDL